MEPSITTTRSRQLRRTSLALAFFFACSLSATALAKETEAEKAAKQEAAQEKLLQVFVSEPYLELSTGPGRGYPVFHVVERDASVDVLFRRTDWFKVRDEHGVEGWARARDLRRTKLADGSPFVPRSRGLWGVRQAQRALCTSTSTVRTVCGSSARTGLCGGWPERAIPTASK